MEGSGFTGGGRLLVEKLAAWEDRAVPHLLRWLADPALARFHRDFRGLLADIGGKDSEAYLAANSPLPEPVPLERKAGPYALQRPSPRLARDSYGISDKEYDLNQWSELSTAEGIRYVAFTHDGLLSARDIYLGVDADADGAFEEILPTGQRDDAVWLTFPLGYMVLAEDGPIELLSDGDSVTIRHYQHVMRESEYGGGSYPGSAVKVNSTFEPSELRRDRDGDGLTDITEKCSIRIRSSRIQMEMGWKT